jgi:(heptosyl)LPS beta-1,4-glucosyltransferase
MPRISACIICQNQQHLITRAIDSLAWCEKIVVVDSGSTDQTPELVKNHPCGKTQLVFEKWRGYNLQREFAASLCPTDWVLLLDADEECSPELAHELQSLPDNTLENVALFEMPRKNYIAKRYVRCWSPDYQTRFVHKQRVNWSPQPVPEIRTPRPPFIMKKLRHALLHNRLTPFTVKDFCDGPRMEHYANVLADAMQTRGKRATLTQILFRPALTFLKYYILKGAFLDGRFGLTIALKTTIGATLKYSVLYARELEQQSSDKLPPRA